MDRPNIPELVKAINELATAWGVPVPTLELSESVIQHVLNDQEWDEIPGKTGWACMIAGIVTESELRRQLIEHCITKILQPHGTSSDDGQFILTPELCQRFDMGLFGRAAHKEPSFESPR